jgi:hypothetical protein
MDDSQRLHLSYVHPLNHVEGMLVAYLPDEKILIEADLFNPGERQAVSAANRSLYTHVQRLNLEVDSVVPIHGQPVPWDDFLDFLGEN